ncbi:hypothetical protein Agub_g15380, partial [Astrephomene gubernaculifera]
FERLISPGREPVVLEGLDLGPAPAKWTPDYLRNLPGAADMKVSVHVSREPSGRLDFVRKNFAFRVISFQELITRLTNQAAEAASSGSSSGGSGAPAASGAAVPAAAPAAGEQQLDSRGGSSPQEGGGAGSSGGTSGSGVLPDLVPRGAQFGEGREVLYLRSIGENPRREAANLSASFPLLAADLRLPPLFPPSALHSSVLRLGSPGLVLWTHYDVMDNLLIQVTGTKRVLLWPPACHDALHVTGSSSPITRPQPDPDLTAFPRFAACPAPLLADLAPGDVLFLPSLWFHNVTTTGGHMSASVNVFWRHLPQEFYHKKDLYANRDLVQAEEADKAADAALAQLSQLPEHYRAFYGARLLGRLGRELGLSA